MLPKNISKSSHREQKPDLCSSGTPPAPLLLPVPIPQPMWGGSCRRSPFFLKGSLHPTAAVTDLAHPLATSCLPTGAGHPAEPPHPSRGHFTPVQSSLAAAEDLENYLQYHQLKGKVFLKNRASCREQAEKCKTPVNLVQGKKSDLKENAGYNYKILEISDFITRTTFLCGWKSQ